MRSFYTELFDTRTTPQDTDNNNTLTNCGKKYSQMCLNLLPKPGEQMHHSWRTQRQWHCMECPWRSGWLGCGWCQRWPHMCPTVRARHRPQPVSSPVQSMVNKLRNKCVYTHTLTHSHTHTHTHTQADMHACMSTHAGTHTRTRSHTHTNSTNIVMVSGK